MRGQGAERGKIGLVESGGWSPSACATLTPSPKESDTDFALTLVAGWLPSPFRRGGRGEAYARATAPTTTRATLAYHPSPPIAPPHETPLPPLLALALPACTSPDSKTAAPAADARFDRFKDQFILDFWRQRPRAMRRRWAFISTTRCW
ncbi:MAG: hypothetical protein WKG07_05560 [Hymenobacter sp.]